MTAKPPTAWLSKPTPPMPMPMPSVRCRFEYRACKNGNVGSWTKPKRTSHGGYARNDTPTTWSEFGEIWSDVVNGRFDGIGLELLNLPGQTLAAIDLDGVHDPTTGRLVPWAATIDVPTLRRPDGSLMQSPRYDPAAGSGPFNPTPMPTIPNRPDKADALRRSLQHCVLWPTQLVTQEGGAIWSRSSPALAGIPDSTGRSVVCRYQSCRSRPRRPARPGAASPNCTEAPLISPWREATS